MARTALFLAIGVLGAGALSGCNVVAGLSDLTIDPATTSSSGGGGTGGTTTGGTTTGGTTTGGTTTGGTTSMGGASCSNGVQDVSVGETDVDCGGPCDDCDLGKVCMQRSDCASGICRQNAGSADPTRKCQGVTKIAVGSAHVCAVLTSTELFCWGSNAHGQLGTGDNNDSAAPVRVQLPSASDVCAGGLPDDKDRGHTCAIDADGKLFCWGANASGQLGTGDFQEQNLPPVANVLSGVKKVATGGLFTCAIGSDDKPVCWGANLYNQLGDGTGLTSAAPVAVANLDPATDLAAGAAHACALMSDGTIRCWGNSQRGQTSASMLVSSTPAVTVPNLAGATRLSAGNDFTCAIDAAGLSCWGDNLDGELTDAVAMDATQTPALLAVSGAVDVAAGADGDVDPNDARGGHACAIVDGGKVQCWGNNNHGQLGRGTTSNKEPAPAEVPGIDGAVQIAAGAEVTCVRLKTGGAACWGRNDRGQVGSGQTGEAVSSPVPVAWP